MQYDIKSYVIEFVSSSVWFKDQTLKQNVSYEAVTSTCTDINNESLLCLQRECCSIFKDTWEHSGHPSVDRNMPFYKSWPKLNSLSLIMVYTTVTKMCKGTDSNDSSGDGSTSNVGGDTWFSRDDKLCINLQKWDDFQMHYFLSCVLQWPC
jgi:hypothetical protein